MRRGYYTVSNMRTVMKSEEDLNQKECVETVDLYEKLESGEIDEWELGDE